MGLDGAEVLSNDQHFVADALKSQNADQLLGAIANVGAARRICAVGYPIQAEEAHHMIDPEGSSMAASFPNRFGKQAVPDRAVPFGMGRRKGPILAAGREVIGRGADAAAGNIVGTICPQVGATTVGGEGKVMIQPDRQATSARV